MEKKTKMVDIWSNLNLNLSSLTEPSCHQNTIFHFFVGYTLLVDQTETTESRKGSEI